jgi:hypothetical protein
MEQDLGKKINENIEKFECPKGFSCCTEGFETLCKARDVGKQTFLECLEPNPRECPFSKLLAAWYICKCPLRIYIAKKLKM